MAAAAAWNEGCLQMDFTACVVWVWVWVCVFERGQARAAKCDGSVQVFRRVVA